MQSVNSASDSVYNGADLIRRANKLRTAALTASRENMELLLPDMEEILKEFDEEETKLKSQIGMTKSLRRFNSKVMFRAKSGLSIFKRRQRPRNNLRLRELPSASHKTFQTQSDSFARLRTLDKSSSSMGSGLIEQHTEPQKISRNPSKTFTSTKSLALGDKDLDPKKRLKFLLCQRRKFEETLKTVRVQASPIVRKVKVKGSVCGVYHPLTGEIEWVETNGGGVFGVWNPVEKKIIWKQDVSSSVAGVFNPDTKKVEWKTVFNGSVCGVYDEIKEKVHWVTSRKIGIYTVFNPVTTEFETKDNSEGSIVGWFNFKEQKVVWDKQNEASLCCVVRDYEHGGYITACCNFTGWRR